MFDHVHPRAVRCGRGRVAEAGRLVRVYGERCLVCTGSTPDRAALLLDSLRQAGVCSEIIRVAGEPTFDTVRQVVETARQFSPHSIAAIGGGSAIDLSKVVSMLLTHAGDPLDYAEVIGRGKSFTKPGIPVLALPTTAGTGAEMTKNAVLRDPDQGVKVSLRSPYMVPDQVILDADTLRSLPPHVMAATGMDALCQLIEAFVCVRSTPWTDAICRAGIALATQHIAAACREEENEVARENMLLAACWSGLALTNAGLGAVHGFAAAAGGMVDIPHGWLCARLLTPVTQANIRKLQEQKENATLLKYKEIAAIMCDDPTASAESAVDWLAQSIRGLPLAEYSIPEEFACKIALDSAQSSSMKANPVSFSPAELQMLWREGMTDH